MLLDAELVLELNVEVGEVQEVGKTPKGFLRLIPITGGTFSGKNIKGKVLSGGYDWNTALNDEIVHAFARYTLQTDDGVYISIENEGYLDSRIQDKKIKTTPRFQISDGKYDWLRSGVFVGNLEAGKTDTPSVSIKVYEMK
ncbi:DUF3237 domain-containing protein [Clostridium folliculivorans]|uniref:UPF0311 protein CFOLD11_02880 n=1 Tax=Clostridium folliculivorans TaxID=2886038 RepID=A0A9W6D970_9CLOT|nr:DUF3237 domain-containing protein [Clostridium folliculivorans]GKU23462.1 hypothetical protein CFOLD11_02880 [Clostridium folliculivorans]GKU29578.1 hypothetical protein CFB3_16850 [Clostridium folliculivorans]